MNAVSRLLPFRVFSFRLLVGLLLLFPLWTASGQEKTEPPAPGDLPKPVAEGNTPEGRLFREYIKTQKVKFAYGRSLKITLPPTGNLTLVGVSRTEAVVEARVHVEGMVPSDLDELSRRIGFYFGPSANGYELTSIGPQIKLSGKERKKVMEGLSSALQKLPYRIDYVLKVPEYTDIDLSMFEGELAMSNTYGGIVFRAQKANVKLTGMAGTVIGTVGTGAVVVELNSLSWRGGGIKVQVGVGDILLSVPRGYSADVTLGASEPLDIKYPLNRGEDVPEDDPIGNQLRARFGVGGAELIFSTQRGKLKVVQYPPVR